MSSVKDTGDNSPVVGTDNIVDFNAGMARALRESFVGLTVKQVARLVGRSPRTVEDWFAGKHCPHALDLRKLSLASGIFGALASRLLAMERALDPETEQALVQLHQMLSKRLDRG